MRPAQPHSAAHPPPSSRPCPQLQGLQAALQAAEARERAAADRCAALQAAEAAWRADGEAAGVAGRVAAAEAEEARRRDGAAAQAAMQCVPRLCYDTTRGRARRMGFWRRVSRSRCAGIAGIGGDTQPMSTTSNRE